uniref:phosphoinositide 5-phosphatase n=1 Tax=Ditylenchus dipsaci TaxID=166011 RepID=A0A915D7D6_9BILA
MSLRGYKIFGKTLPNGIYSIIVESVHYENFLLIQSGALLTLDKDVGNNLKSSYTKFSDGYGLLGVLKLDNQGDSYLIVVSGVFSVGQLYNCDVYKITAVQFIPLFREASQSVLDPRIVDLQRLLSAGVFYFAYSSDRQHIFNLSLSSQKRHASRLTDYRFFWNRNLGFPFERYGINPENWLVQCMCGSVLIRTIYVGHRTAKVAIISRLSCERVGTRFNVRGVNDDGNVANFVETEQLITFEEQESSFVQIRGSVPLFWEQPGINVGSHKVKLKPFEVSMPALERHYAHLKQYYGNVATVNLLGSKEGERLLSNAFETALKTSSHSEAQVISFDYHAQLKQSKDAVKYLLRKIESIIGSCQFFHKQFDCVLKLSGQTNSVQTLIGMEALTLQMALLALDQIKANITGRFEEVMKDLWQKNGDQCSIIYAGTGALEGKSKLKDASRSIARTIQNNLMDSSKQESFDLLLLGCTFGNQIFDKASNLLPTKILRADYYIYVFVGTWNVNGGKNMYNVAFRHEQSLETWVFPTEILNAEFLAYDILAIGLEEIVDLNAGNMMKASTTNQRVWRDGIKNSINEFSERMGKGKYVALACEQLVGVCLIIFVKPHLMGKIRDFAVGECKTGMGGATGNKGSVLVRFTIHSTSVCFVCSHFAAGQNEVFNRNEDYQTALRKIRFPLGRTISSHDVVYWLGDFNYRISLNGEEVKSAARSQNFEHLVKYDQLTQQKEAGNVFQGFKEGPLNFAPTYKYDTFSDDYDTSEKCRSPAWTDRVLGVTLWTSSPTALWSIRAQNLDKCEEIISDVVCSMGPPDATILCSIEGCPDSFPTNACAFIFEKLQNELGIQILASKIERQYLHIILPSGVEALASLSMDQITLFSGQKLHVQEAREEAASLDGSSDAQLWTAVNINLEEDEDEDASGIMRSNTPNSNSFADFELIGQDSSRGSY